MPVRTCSSASFSSLRSSFHRATFDESEGQSFDPSSVAAFARLSLEKADRFPPSKRMFEVIGRHVSQNAASYRIQDIMIVVEAFVQFGETRLLSKQILPHHILEALSQPCDTGYVSMSDLDRLSRNIALLFPKTQLKELNQYLNNLALHFFTDNNESASVNDKASALSILLRGSVQKRKFPRDELKQLLLQMDQLNPHNAMDLYFTLKEYHIAALDRAIMNRLSRVVLLHARSFSIDTLLRFFQAYDFDAFPNYALHDGLIRHIEARAVHPDFDSSHADTVLAVYLSARRDPPLGVVERVRDSLGQKQGKKALQYLIEVGMDVVDSSFHHDLTRMAYMVASLIEENVTKKRFAYPPTMLIEAAHTASLLHPVSASFLERLNSKVRKHGEYDALGVYDLMYLSILNKSNQQFAHKEELSRALQLKFVATQPTDPALNSMMTSLRTPISHQRR